MADKKEEIKKIKTEEELNAEYRSKVENDRIEARKANTKFVQDSVNKAQKESLAHDKNSTVAGIGDGKKPKYQ